MLYRLIRPLLFALPPERAHAATLRLLDAAGRCGLLQALPAVPARPVRVMGLDFPNPVGLAAGLDKDGAHIDALAALGFGFVEIGTVTPRPQPGNPQPRLFRLPAADALINRMGFNNLGVDNLVANVRRARRSCILGINIGKNFDTPIERAAEDYLVCLEKVYSHADYVTVNISSPNTKNLRALQEADALDALLGQLKDAQAQLAARHGRYVPLAVKIAPDLDAEQIARAGDLLGRHAIDAVIATNTTISRDNVAGLAHAMETGGLSGRPVREASTRVLRQLRAHLPAAIPIIGVGGIVDGDDAQEKLAAGASLVQIYTGLIYRGPALIRDICTTLQDR